MAETSIEWANRSWNFLAGCTILTPGCAKCYAMQMAARIERMSPDLAHYRGLTKPSKAGPVWTGKIGIAEGKLLEPLRVRKPAKWFVNSMSDLFHEDVPDAIIDKAFAVMALCPHHTFQILTKRSARMRDYFTKVRHSGGLCDSMSIAWDIAQNLAVDHSLLDRYQPQLSVLPNVWLGVSVEDQKRADERIPDLLATPSAVRWISAEPLLGPVNLDCPDYDWMQHPDGLGISGNRLLLDWVVVGGESGRGARPMHPDWVRSIRDQCAAAGVPFFFKQWGEFLPTVEQGTEVDLRKIGKDHVAANPTESGTHMRYRRVGKGRAGRLLDGREHNEFPSR